MTSHPTSPYFLCSKRPEFSPTSLPDYVKSSVLLISSTSFRISSDQSPLPPSFVSMPLCLSLISLIALLVTSQLFAQRGRPVLRRLPFEPLIQVVSLPALRHLWRPFCPWSHFLQSISSLFSSLIIHLLASWSRNRMQSSWI